MLAFFAALALTIPPTDRLGDPLPPGAVARYGTVRFRVGSERVRYSHALSPDGKLLAVEDRDGIALWDTETGRVARRLPWRTWQGTNPKFGLAFSPDGKRLARLAGRVVAVWDLATGKEQFDIDYKAEGEFRAIAFVPGKDELTVTGDQKPRAWTLDARTGKVLRTTTFQGEHKNLEPAGSYVLDRVPTAWVLFDPNTGTELVRFVSGYDKGEAFVLSADGKRAWIADTDGLLRQFDVPAGNRTAAAGPPPGWKSGEGHIAVAVGPDAGVVYVVNGRQGIHRWDVKARRWLPPVWGVPAGWLLPHPDGRRLLVIGKDGVLRRYDPTRLLAELPGPDGFEDRAQAVPSPDGRRVAVNSGGFERPRRLDLFEAGGGPVWSARARVGWGAPRWSPDGIWLACLDERIVLRNPATGEVVRTLTAPDRGILSGPAFFPPGGDRLIAPVSAGEAIAAFDPGTGAVAKVWHPGMGEVMDLSPDGRIVLFQDGDKGLRLYDLAAGRFATDWIPRQPDHENWSAARPGFSPDGSYLLTWDLEPRRQEWRPRGVMAVLRDPRTGARREIRELDLSLEFEWALSPDGLWLAVGSPSGKVDLFDMATGHGLGRWEGHRDAVSSIHFVGPGRVLTASADLTALLWDVRPKAGPDGPAWAALAGRDGTQAWRAVWALAADPKAPDLLRAKVPVPAASPAEKVKQWLADLGADRYPVREAATKALQDLGRPAEPDLRAARDRATTEEVRTRLDGLLAKVNAVRSPAEVVQARAVAALEGAGTPEARKVLEEWAAGAPGARLTTDARAALKRISLRERSPAR